MSYKEKPQIKLYKYENNSFVLQAIIDDYQEASFERNLYQAGVFTITINFNIPNSQLFQRGLFVQFGNDKYDFGEIYSIQDSIGEDGKGSQIRTITGYDARYILKRRVIRNMNSNGLWVMTAKGELCLRNLIKDQCGSSAEEKRRLPINNIIPASADAIGKEYSVSEQFTNLYEVCKTIATQSEIGWRIAFENGELNLEVYAGEDLSQTIRFDTSYESLANGEFSDSSESFSNSIYVGGKGQNDDRDIYEGEAVLNETNLKLSADTDDVLLIDNEGSKLVIDGLTPNGMNRFESYDNQSSMTTESEYEAEALSMLTQYGQTIQMAGNGLAKCPYIYKEQYNVGDWITVAFSGKSAVVQILSVTEHWAWGQYDLEFSFGKPQNNLAEQLQLMLRKIQSASNKSSSTDSIRWYTIPTDTEMPKADVTYNTIGFIGSCAEGGSTFKLYLDNEKTGAKTYHVYFKQLGGGKLTLTTGVAGAQNLIMNSGTYVAIIYVDVNGNITMAGATATSVIQVGNNQPVESGAVADRVDKLAYDNYNNDENNPIDVLSIILTMPLGKVSSLRIGGFTTNSPFGSGNINTDCFYTVYRLPERDDYIRVICYDVRDNNIFENAKCNGSWLSWSLVSSQILFDTAPAMNGTLLLNLASVIYRNGVIQFALRFMNYTTPTQLTDGDVIATIKYEYRPLFPVPINVHNFATNQDYILWIQTNGNIEIYGTGNQTVLYDFYGQATYVK